MSRLTRLMLILGMLLVVASCGKKGPPIPPEATAPSPVSYFSAAGTVEGVRLSWTVPDTDASGKRLRDLAGFVVARNEFEQGKRKRFQELLVIDIDADDEEQLLRKQYDVLDRDVKPGSRYEYVVYPYNDDGVEGRASSVLRVRFTGESSSVEVL